MTQVQLTVSDEEADEIAQRVYKTLLKPAPDAARAQLEELALRHEPREYAAGERLRAVAAELVSRGLEVTAVDYRDGSQGLEVVLSSARQVGLVTVDRDGSGQGCQISWEEWRISPTRPGCGGSQTSWTPCCAVSPARAGDG